MDRIWIETLKRLDALEERCSRIEKCTMITPLESTKPESEKDTVDLPSAEPKQG